MAAYEAAGLQDDFAASAAKLGRQKDHHDGKLFLYQNNNGIVEESLYNSKVVKFLIRRYNEIESQILAVNEIAREMNLVFKELLR